MSKSKKLEVDKKGLQNFTPNPVQKAEPSIDKVFLQSKLREAMTTIGAEHDYLVNKISQYLSDDELNYVKERNVQLIREELVKYIKSNQQGMPTVTTLSLLTKLSRVTVTKHLKEIFNSDLEAHKKILHKHTFDIILTNLARKAMSGDLSATKLYIDTMIKLDEKDNITMYIKNQQNNIVVNPEK